MNYFKSYFIIIAFVGVSLSHQISADTNKINLLPTQWTKNWDFNARSLELASGIPSKIATVLQPRINRLDFFGFLGAFPASTGKNYVGFAKISTDIKAGSLQEKIHLKVSTTTPDLIFKIVLKEDATSDQHSFQADFQTSDKPQTIALEPKDFQYVRRGKTLASTNQVNFKSVVSIGFLITRSHQKKPLPTTLSLLPFNLQIHALTSR